MILLSLVFTVSAATAQTKGKSKSLGTVSENLTESSSPLVGIEDGLTLQDTRSVEVQSPDSEEKLSVEIKKYSAPSKSYIKQLAKKLHLIEHKHSGSYVGQIMNLRNLSFVILHGSTVVIWSLKPLQWDLKAAALVVSTIGNIFFIYYENILDEKLYSAKTFKNIVEVPLAKFLSAYHRIKDIDHSFRKNHVEKISHLSAQSGKLLSITIVNWAFLYYYNSLLNSGSTVVPYEIFMESLSDLSVFLGTGLLLSAVRTNLKKHGRMHFSEIQIQKSAFVLNLSAGISFIALATNFFPKEAILVSLGVPSLIALYLTSSPDKLGAAVPSHMTNQRSCLTIF